MAKKDEFDKAFDKAFKVVMDEISKQPFEQSQEEMSLGLMLPYGRIKQLSKRLYNTGYTKGIAHKKRFILP